MPKTIRVTVTEQDIKDGEPQDPDRCPVAIATRRSIDGRCGVSVDNDDLRIGAARYSVPEVVQFVKDFDWCYPVKPFSFTLEKP